MDGGCSFGTGVREQWIVSALAAVLLAAGTAVVYGTGGTAYAWPYVMFIPMLIAAAWLGIPGGLAAGVAAGLLLGPLMPLNVQSGEMQSADN